MINLRCKEFLLNPHSIELFLRWTPIKVQGFELDEHQHPSRVPTLCPTHHNPPEQTASGHVRMNPGA